MTDQGADYWANKKPTKRARILARAKVAGYHDDSAGYVRAVCDGVYVASKAAIDEAWRLGAKMKANGIRCDCRRCQAEGGEA